ncbi:Dyp-type peroxidase domain-containing protein [Catenulispora yoronensis]
MAATADDGPGPSGRRIPFEGPHQAGILTAPQAAASFVAFDVTARTPDELRALFRTLTERVRFLTAGGAPAATDVASPPTDSQRPAGPRRPPTSPRRRPTARRSARTSPPTA